MRTIRSLFVALVISLERRWATHNLPHLVASAGGGQLVNSYNYSCYSKTGGSEFHQAELTKIPYATVAVGGELNITGWTRFLFRPATGAPVPRRS